jgi:hypothetical protein
MRATELAAALVDNAPRRITALDPVGRRSFEFAVAGPAALLIAKLHKIGERVDRTPNRLKNKDASDLFLLLRATRTEALADTLRRLRELPATGETTETAVRFLRELFSSAAGVGIGLLRAAVADIEDEEITAQSCVALTQDLLDALS